jgi:hypothetical protein
VNDNLFNETLASAVFEYVTYNPNLNYYILTTITLQQSAAGLIIPLTRSRAMRKDLYTTSLDYFRAFLEIIYVIFVLYHLLTELRDFI